jgi:condensation domain-containing protein/phosphopantetheine binding protein
MSEVLDQIISIWREVLAPAYVGPDTDFFDCGGNSLNAARIVARMARDVRLPVRVRTVFENPSPLKLAAALPGTAATDPGPGPIVAEPGDAAVVPMSSQQEAVWFMECLNPAGRGHNCVTTARLPEPLEPDRLRSALQHVVDRHEALRTCFSTVDGRPVQAVSDRAVADLRIRGRISGDELARELRELSEAPFDVARLPLIFWVLYEDAERGGSILAQVEHRFLYDAWSAWLVLDQAAQAYRGGAGTAEPPAGYRAFARWQRDWLAGADAARQRGYWANLLTGDHGVARFPHDERRPHIFSQHGETITAALGPRLTGTLPSASAALAATPFSIIFSAFGILIGSETKTSNLVIGTAYRNRQTPFEDTVGVLMNVLGIPFPEWEGITFRNVVRATSALLADGYDNQAIPFAAVARELRLRPQLSRNPLFQVCLSINEGPGDCLDFGDGKACDIDFVAGGTRFDLDVVIAPPEDQRPWRMLWRYYAEVLTAAEVTSLAERFEALTGFLIEDPDLPLSRDLVAIHAQQPRESHAGPGRPHLPGCRQ